MIPLYPSGLFGRVGRWVGGLRSRRRWRILRSRGLKIGESTQLPDSTWIDASCCYAIEIGNNVGVGPECLILAHDAQMNGVIGVARVAKVVIHDDCRIGARTMILPGVEIGPRTIVFAGSVVSRSLPPDTVCGGSPARPLGAVRDYADAHRDQVARSATFPRAEYGMEDVPRERRAELVAALAVGDVYILGEHAERLLPVGEATDQLELTGLEPGGTERRVEDSTALFARAMRVRRNAGELTKT